MHDKNYQTLNHFNFTFDFKKMPQWNNKKLMKVVQHYLPVSSADWEKVAQQYQLDTCETKLREVSTMKRQWTEKLCNKGKKPTGKVVPYHHLLCIQ